MIDLYWWGVAMMANAVPDAQISGTWVLELVTKIFGGLAVLAGAVWAAYKKGQKAPATETTATLKEPVPEIPTRRVYSPPTFYQHQELVRRVSLIEAEAKEHREHMEEQLRDIRREQSEQFVKLMTAGEARKDQIMENMNSMVRAFHARVDQLVDHKPKRQ